MTIFVWLNEIYKMQWSVTIWIIEWLNEEKSKCKIFYFEEILSLFWRDLIIGTILLYIMTKCDSKDSKVFCFSIQFSGIECHVSHRSSYVVFPVCKIVIETWRKMK